MSVVGKKREIEKGEFVALGRMMGRKWDAVVEG
jgi:hypothetical protein